MALLLFVSVSGHVLAMLLAPLPPPEETIDELVIIGTFAMDLEVADVNDLYGWQVAIVYNPDQIKILDFISGGFIGDDFPFFMNSTDTFDDLLLLAGSIIGDAPGKTGSGKLATITFGYYTENYDEPKIVPEKVFETLLLDSQGQPIPVNDYTLTLNKA